VWCVAVTTLSTAFAFRAAETGEIDEEGLAEILGGFEEQQPPVETEAGEAAEHGASTAPGRFWDISGSLELTGSVNFRDHHSVGGGSESPPPIGTDYSGLQRLRQRLNLQLDVDLPRDWKLRLAGYGFYDFAYLANDRDNYTDSVLNKYEWELDSQEAYIQGAVLPPLDLKLGRQIVNWGRSESIRILDVLNPVDNREPGRADFEELHLAVAMARLDYYIGRWSLTGLVVPEIRFDKLPVSGSDFYPLAVDPIRIEPNSFSGDVEYGFALTGIFQGWDVSFHFARFWNDLPYTQRLLPATDPSGAVVKHAFLTMAGAGGNYAAGNWLFKAEFAWKDGYRFFYTNKRLSRLDALVGVEYYGFEDTQITIELANRHLLDFQKELKSAPDYAQEDRVESSIRLARSFLRDRLNVEVLALLFGLTAQDGSLVRVRTDYDLRDSLTIGVGILLYQQGDLPISSIWARNDRFIFRVKYTF